MPLDGYFLTHLKQELLNSLEGFYLRKIKMPNKRAFSFEFYGNKTKHLYIDLSPNNAHLRLSKEFDHIESHPFLTSLRHFLLNAKLTDITQYKKDRILFFHFIVSDPFKKEMPLTLVLEIMGRTSNLILVDNGIIIDAFHKRFNEDKRSILPKLNYEVFPTDKALFSYQNIHEYTSPKDLFTRCMGFSYDLATFVYNYQIDIDNEPVLPCLFDTGYHAFDLRLTPKKEFSTLSSLIEEAHTMKESLSPIYHHLETKLKKHQDKLFTLEKEYSSNQDFNAFKVIADSIYASNLDLMLHYTEFEGHALNYQKTLNENAQHLYKLYKKKKDSLAFLKQEIHTVKEFILYYQELIDNFDNLDVEDLKLEIKPKSQSKQKKKKSTHLTFSEKTYMIYVGRSSIQNEYLTHTFANKDDLWFHVKDYPGSHVLLRGEKSEESLRKAALLAATHSPLKNSSSVAVVYTEIKNIKKIKGKPGFTVSYKHEKTIYIDP